MVPGVGPTFDWRLETPADISKLNLRPDVDAALGYVFDGIFETYRQLQGAVPIIGFAGAPLTLLTYMAQGAGGAGDKWRAAKLFFFNYPHAAHKMLDALADVAIQFLVKQFKAGAHVLQVRHPAAASPNRQKSQRAKGHTHLRDFGAGKGKENLSFTC
eukprot:GHVT01033173.1.p2 GENE.GHVT01033173.1~~GHVT01033173.1.p2  ORF type:complete len:158 (-),score=47.32 GHVT01033173.1:100-573(-)